MLNKITIFGVGLIGGSFALALKQAGAVKHVVGVSRTATSLTRAQARGIIDVGTDDVAMAVAGADLVLLATPVAQTQDLLARMAPHLAPETVVTDAGSTKCDVVAAARAELGAKIAQFVPGHPIAGSERNGPDAAWAGLYQGKKVVLAPLAENHNESVHRVTQAWQACGALIHYLTPQDHDAVFASVSHLPHLLAFALVDDLAQRQNADLLFQYAASGFRDFTRIAASSPEMWRDISLANQPALLQELDAYMAQLDKLRSFLATGDGTSLKACFARAQQARHAWGQTIETAESPSQIKSE